MTKLFVTGRRRPDGCSDLEVVKDDGGPTWGMTPCERDGLSFREHCWVVYEPGRPVHIVHACSLTP
jgi:hypothetical protein